MSVMQQQQQHRRSQTKRNVMNRDVMKTTRKRERKQKAMIAFIHAVVVVSRSCATLKLKMKTAPYRFELLCKRTLICQEDHKLICTAPESLFTILGWYISICILLGRCKCGCSPY